MIIFLRIALLALVASLGYIITINVHAKDMAIIKATVPMWYECRQDGDSLSIATNATKIIVNNKEYVNKEGN